MYVHTYDCHYKARTILRTVMVLREYLFRKEQAASMLIKIQEALNFAEY